MKGGDDSTGSARRSTQVSSRCLQHFSRTLGLQQYVQDFRAPVVLFDKNVGVDDLLTPRVVLC